MDRIIQIIQRNVLFPHYVGYGKIHDGYIFKTPLKCKSCSQICSALYNKLQPRTFTTCRNGFSIYISEIGGKRVQIVGLYIRGNLDKLPRKKKKMIVENLIDMDMILNWERETNSLISEIETYKDMQVKNNISMFHDMTPTISLIFRSLETLIDTFEGNTFEDKVENLPSEYKTLYHSVDLLKNRLRMMPIILNPGSVNYGQLAKYSVFKIIDKIRRLFINTAKLSNTSIQISSNKYISYEPLVYDSFMTLPFVLIENAVKYSKKGSNIYINLNESDIGLDVSIKSFGPTVGQENLELIFSNGFKDPNAVKFSSKGSGIGLYLAQLVANAHNIEIKYNCTRGETVENIEYGYNTFSFFIRRENKI